MAKTITGDKKESTTYSGKKPAFVFGRINFILMVVGIVLIAGGYLMMIGGAPKDPAKFNSEELYSTSRITIAPIVIVIGLVIEVFAIMIKAKD